MAKKDYGVSADIGGNLTKIILIIIGIAIVVVGGIFGVAYFQEQSRLSAIESRKRAEANDARRSEEAQEKIYIKLNSPRVNELCKSWSTGDYDRINSDERWEDVDFYIEEDTRGYSADVSFYAYGKSVSGRRLKYDYSAIIRFTKYGSVDKCLSIEYLGRHDD